MTDKNLVVRQGTIQFTKDDLKPTSSEFLIVTPDGLVNASGIDSDNFDNYTLLTVTEDISGDLQSQIDSLAAASSGGVASINNVTNPGGNIDFITNTDELTILPDNNDNTITLDIDFSDYATGTQVQALSSAIDDIVPESTTIQSSAGSILVTQDGTDPYMWNLEVATVPTQNHNELDGLQGGDGVDEFYHLTEAQFNDYIGATEVASISSSLDGQISSIEGDVSDLQTNVQFISGAVDEIDIVGIDGISVQESPTRTWTVSVTGDYAESSDLDDYVLKAGDTMTGDLTVPNLLVQSNATVNGNLYVNGTEFIVDVETISASDNIIVINGGEVGPGVTSGFSGIRVDRGSVDDYFFIFDENREGFAIGLSQDETAGQLGLTQMVATREDSPIAGGYAVWNDTENRFDTVDSSTIATEISGSFVNKTGDEMTGDLNMQSANVNITNGSLSIDGSSQTYSENDDVDIGTETIDSFDVTLGVSAHWVVSIRKGITDARTSLITAVWLNGVIEFNETSTNDIGDTLGVVMDVVITGSNVELRATVDSNDWVIKAHRTLI